MLIDDIIDQLSRDSGSLNEALLKTKVLLRLIGKKDLVGWVNSELSGYAPGSDLPEYRKVIGLSLAALHDWLGVAAALGLGGVFIAKIVRDRKRSDT